MIFQIFVLKNVSKKFHNFRVRISGLFGWFVVFLATLILHFTKKKNAIGTAVSHLITKANLNNSTSNEKMVNMKTIFLVGIVALMMISYVVAKSIFIGALKRTRVMAAYGGLPS